VLILNLHSYFIFQNSSIVVSVVAQGFVTTGKHSTSELSSRKKVGKSSGILPLSRRKVDKGKK